MISNLQAAKNYLAALEKGADREVLAAMLSPDLAYEAFPHRFEPKGAQHDFEGYLQSIERARELFARQRYALRNTMASGDTIALEIDWSGTLAAASGNLAAGTGLRASCALFLDFRGGRIVRQRNYHCFLPQ